MRDDIEIYFSKRLRRSLIENLSEVPPGAAHYSYSSVAKKFVTALQNAGWFPIEIDRPEIYTQPPLSQGNFAIHLMFKPFEEIRFLRGALNIAHIAWEFPVLPSAEQWRIGDPRRNHPFSDYKRMLCVPDRVWVGCDFTAKVLHACGISHVDVVPAPIMSTCKTADDLRRSRTVGKLSALRAVAKIKAFPLNRRMHARLDSEAISENMATLENILRLGSRIFLSIASPGDIRKNLPALLDGFSLARQQNPDILLLLKVTIDDNHVRLGDVLRDIIPRRYAELERNFGEVSLNDIYVIGDYLSDSVLKALYRCSDFFLSTSFAEGQGLPLQEAMAEGVVPITPCHTAMSDYINSENAVVISHKYIQAPWVFSAAYGLTDFSVAYSTEDDVKTSIIEAASMDHGSLAEKSMAAWSTIKQNYSEEAVVAVACQILDDLRASW